jgi:TM2 domain-containing membrane protein YozV
LDEGQAFCDKCGNKAGGGDGQAHTVVINVNEKSAGIAAVLSFLWAGAGQIYVGKIGRGLALLLTYSVIVLLEIAIVFIGFSPVGSYDDLIGILVFIAVMTVLWIVIWIWNIYDAYKLANQYNDHLRANNGNRPW